MWQVALPLVCQKNRLLSGRPNNHLLSTNGSPKVKVIIIAVIVLYIKTVMHEHRAEMDGLAFIWGFY